MVSHPILVRRTFVFDRLWFSVRMAVVSCADSIVRLLVGHVSVPVVFRYDFGQIGAYKHVDGFVFHFHIPQNTVANWIEKQNKNQITNGCCLIHFHFLCMVCIVNFTGVQRFRHLNWQHSSTLCGRVFNGQFVIFVWCRSSWQATWRNFLHESLH